MTETPVPAPRRRPTFRALTVARIETPTPRLRRMIFAGENLAGFGPPRAGAHVKLFFDAGAAAWTAESGHPRPPSRTYTPRRFDPARHELEVEFVLHGEGLASSWAETAKVGDPITVAGPGGGTDIAPDLRAAVLLVDESAMPAAGMIIDALPADCAVTLICEVEDATDELVPSARTVAGVRWLHRQPAGAAPGSLLLEAARTLPLTDGAQWWVACEAQAMRAIKAHLLAERGLDRTRLISRGYWKYGAANHPDHDHGE